MKDKEGNTIIVSKPYRWDEVDKTCQVVLRHLPESAEPYVTHVYNSTKDLYFCGHYFRKLEDALKDFEERK